MFTKGLSEFITRNEFEDLPEGVVGKAKWAIFDFIGVAMAGSQEISGKIINDFVKESTAIQESTVICGGYKTSCSLAALANGTFGHVLDYDDCLDFPHVGLGHPTTGILPAALALGEKLNVAGRDLITAYVIGIEAYAKIGLLAKDAFRADKGWEWTGVLGVLGATAAAAKLLCLDKRQTEMALGIAASLSCGLTRNFGSMAGHFHAGNAARCGIEAASLAYSGFNASDDIIEVNQGFYNLFTGNTDPVPQEILQEYISSLGNPWNIINPGFMHKAFPCAHISHFGVDAALQLRIANAIDWQQIEEIEFRIPSLLQRIVSYQEPRTSIEAKFSPAYCMCRALIFGGIKIADFRDENFMEPSIAELMKKIKWVVLEQKDEELPFGFQEITVKMKDGRLFTCRVSHPKGEPQNPLTNKDAGMKFEDCLSHTPYNSDRADRIKAVIFEIEKLEGLSLLTTLF